MNKQMTIALFTLNASCVSVWHQWRNAEVDIFLIYSPPFH